MKLKTSRVGLTDQVDQYRVHADYRASCMELVVALVGQEEPYRFI